MSTRVFSRFTMSEGRLPRGTPPGQDIERVRRALFPSQNMSQHRQFAAEQLAAMQKQKSEHYEFDFEAGQPFDTSVTCRYKWEKVESTEAVPEAYEFKRLPYLRTHAESDDVAEASKSADEAEVPRSRQTSITDFMQKRKSVSTSETSSKPVSSSSDGEPSMEPSAKKQKVTATTSSES